MVSWSALGRAFGINLLINNSKTPIKVQNVSFSTGKVDYSHGHRVMAVQPSRWQWIKCKDMFHLYFMIGIIPVMAVIFYTNVFIGPATLTKKPKGYCAKHWEYHRHPITRFIAQYIHNSPQQEYEKFLHFLDEEMQKAKLRKLEAKALELMGKRRDSVAYYYRSVPGAKYLRINQKIGQEMYDRVGDIYEPAPPSK